MDCATISEALHLDAVRRCPDSGLFDVLYSFSKRAVSIGPDGIGWVPVLMRPGRRPPGMRGRVICGVGKLPDPPQPKASAKKKAKKQEGEEPDPRKSFIDKLPPEIQKELKLGVPDQLVGRSAFAFKKLVRYIVRCRLGSVEVDICNAFFQLLHKIVPLPGALAEYLDNREEKLEAIGHALLSSLPPKERRKEAKRLLIRLGFGGSFANWAATEVGRVPLQSDAPPVGPLASWLYRFESEARRWHTAVFETMTEEASTWTRGDPTPPALSPCMPTTRTSTWAGCAKAAAPSSTITRTTAWGVLRGGIRFVIAAVPDIKVATQELEDPWVWAAGKFPNLDWKLKAPMETEDFARLRQRCRHHVLFGRARQNTVEFAKLAAALLAPVVHVPVEGGEKRTTFECFERGGFWLVRNRDDLGQFLEELLCNLCRPVFAPDQYIPPYPLNDNLFFSGLSSSVLGRLAGPALPDLDGDDTRFKILFCDGKLYDFKERILRSPVPADRLGFHAKATSEMWQPSQETTLFEDIKDYLKDHLATGVELLEGSEAGRRVIQAFEALQRDGCEILGYLKAYGDWDSVLYELRVMARAITASPRFCEMYYIWGPQGSGKDTKVKMLHSFFGHGEQHYGVSLPGEYLVQQSRQSAKESASPYHARTLGKRLAWASEIPEHFALADDFIKPFCDMEGAPVTSRKLHRAPKDFMPTALLVGTSNSPPQVPRPDGMLRRLRVCQTTVRFTQRPGSATEALAVDDLKSRINRGHFNKYLFYFAANLVDTLYSRPQPRHRVDAAAAGDEDECPGPRPCHSRPREQPTCGLPRSVLRAGCQEGCEPHGGCDRCGAALPRPGDDRGCEDCRRGDGHQRGLLWPEVRRHQEER